MRLKGWTEADYRRCAADGAWICLSGQYKRGEITRQQFDEQWAKVRSKALSV
jgi:hypothetical protein